jgi:hypothetical protein
MDPTKPPTITEALRYDKTALEADIVRKKQNIQMLQGEIAKMETEINWMNQVIALIDANK